MFQYKIFKKFLLGGKTTSGVVCAAAPVLAPSCEKDDGSCGISKAIADASKCDKAGTHKPCDPSSKVRPSQLPLYGCEDRKPRVIVETEEEPSSLELTIGAARKELWAYFEQFKDFEKTALDVIDTGKAHTETAIIFLREEATTVHRAGAIGVGGLAGIIMGLRGGWFKRIIYGTTGAAAMAALCYPKESAEIGQESVQMAKYYFNIVYHFIYGVNPEGFKFFGISPLDKFKDSPVPDKTPAPVKEEIQQLGQDQSNPADKDLYTTRS